MAPWIRVIAADEAREQEEKEEEVGEEEEREDRLPNWGQSRRNADGNEKEHHMALPAFDAHTQTDAQQFILQLT